MRTIRLTVTDSEYETFRRAAERVHRPVEQVILEALAMFRRERLESKAPLRELTVLRGHRPLASLPSRADLHDEMFAGEDPGGRP